MDEQDRVEADTAGFDSWVLAKMMGRLVDDTGSEYRYAEAYTAVVGQRYRDHIADDTAAAVVVAHCRRRRYKARGHHHKEAPGQADQTGSTAAEAGTHRLAGHARRTLVPVQSCYRAWASCIPIATAARTDNSAVAAVVAEGAVGDNSAVAESASEDVTARVHSD